MTTERIWELYLQGKIEVAEMEARKEFSQVTDLVTKQALHAILAWCAYRRKEYKEALMEITAAGDNQRAHECHVYVLAYAPGFADDKKLFELTELLVGNINVSNALVIRARMPESTVEHEQVWRMAQGFAEDADVSKHNVSLANLMHNCSRFFLDKARDRRDLEFSLGLIEVAIAHYGEVSNWHHRAAANFWKSHTLERLTAIPSAFAAAALSLQLWECQCALEKKTAPFLDKLESVRARVVDLAAKLVEFAKRANG